MISEPVSCHIRATPLLARPRRFLPARHVQPEYQQARALDEEALARRRRVLGDDHPDTLSSANNLAADLRAPGEPAENDETPFAGDLPWARSWSRSPASGNVQHRHPAQVTGGQSGRGNGGMIDDDKRP